MDDPAPPAELLGGKYVLGALLGTGGTGSVYRATEPARQRTVAVKILRPERRADCELPDRFDREALVSERLAHPNLVTIHDVGVTDDGRPFLVMEYVAGRPLGALVRERPLSIERACAIGGQLLAALAAAHRAGVVHADVKSDNVLVGDGDRIKLVDFGLARLRTDAAGEGRVAGTPEYMAPEVIRGGTPTPASDLYGVGVIVYEMITGVTPFGGGSPLEILTRHLAEPVPLPSRRRPERVFPHALEALLERALAKLPAERIADADQLAAELAAIGRTAAATRWCPACGSPLERAAGECAACRDSLAWAATAIEAHAAAAVGRWRRESVTTGLARRSLPR